MMQREPIRIAAWKLAVEGCFLVLSVITGVHPSSVDITWLVQSAFRIAVEMDKALEIRGSGVFKSIARCAILDTGAAWETMINGRIVFVPMQHLVWEVCYGSYND